jgi:hypothetical protein
MANHSAHADDNVNDPLDEKQCHISSVCDQIQQLQ